MAKVKDILGPPPPFHIDNFDGITVDPAQIWTRYDSEADSVVIYFNGSPQPAVSVYTDDNLYVMVDPKSRDVVGLHVENWEQSFVPAHDEIQTVWSQFKGAFQAEQPLNDLLRMLALWTISVLQAENTGPSALQPA